MNGVAKDEEAFSRHMGVRGHSRQQDQYENRPGKIMLCFWGDPKHVELTGRSIQVCHGGPSYHTKELEFHPLYDKKSTN